MTTASRTRRVLWSTLGIASALWVGSWRIIYLEVTRWHHMDSHLRFTAPHVPGAGPSPSPGLPVISAVIVAAAAPPTALVAALLLVRLTRTTRSR